MPRHRTRASLLLRAEVLEVRSLLSASPISASSESAVEGLFRVGSASSEVDPTQILVRYRDDAGPLFGPEPGGLTPGRRLLGTETLRVVGVDPDVGLDASLEAARNDPRVVYAEPNLTIHGSSIPDDPLFAQLWGLENTGRPPAPSGVADADIDATAAWDIERGSRATVVAVIDTGIDESHPDLAANLWSNPGEIAGNGVDDDRNGFVDDVRGWDFVHDDNDPSDDNGHGTAVAGVIGAVGDNGIGVTGVNWDVSLMPLKILDSNGSGTILAAIDAIDYAWRNGATISNNSWNVGTYSQALRDAIQQAGLWGDHLVVASSGNSGQWMDNPSNPNRSYPAGFDLPNVLSVAASDPSDRLASFSNFGEDSVDLAAPGVEILSTRPGNSYHVSTGTSMAAPHVAGAAALLHSADPSLSTAQIVDTILDTVDPLDVLPGFLKTSGRLNVASALERLDHDGPHLASGTVELPSTDTWTRVTLDHSYESPVVAAVPHIRADDPSLMTRVRNVVGNSFEVLVTEAGDASTPDEPIELLDGGFETPSVGGGYRGYRYRPQGSAWTFDGGAGITSNDTAFTDGNPPAPGGDQAGFLQRTGAARQTVQVGLAGTYRLDLKAAQRGNYAHGGQDFAVVVDGDEVARFRPSGTSYQSLSAQFELDAGPHEIALVGRNSTGGDNTVFIDQVGMSLVETTAEPSLLEGGFESPSVGSGYRGYRYRPSGSAWTFVSNAGITSNDTAFTEGNPPAPGGDQAGFLQRTGAARQTVQVGLAGTYRLDLKAAQRGNYAHGGQDFAVVVDGDEVARFRPSGTSYQSLSAQFELDAGPHEIALVGRNSTGGDNTAFIDQVALNKIGVTSARSGPIEVGVTSARSGPIEVSYLVAEAGTYTEARDGVTLEAHTLTDTHADPGGPGAAFPGQAVSYDQSYRSPVVIGQVMTSHDPRPSTFFAHGVRASDPPSSSVLRLGMQVGEDPSPSRVPEQLGYFVFEAGRYDIGGNELIAGTTSRQVRGIDDGPTNIPLVGLADASAAVVSAATMRGRDGSWPALFGDDPINADHLEVVALEDQWDDPERSHPAEAVSYVVIGRPVAASTADDFGGRPSTPGLSTIVPRITVTRTSGIAPLVVQVSASETFADAGDAYTDLEYQWDFGDPDGSETFNHPVTGASVVANVDQSGPEAAYVYREPGRYTITLTVRGKDEHGTTFTAMTSTLLEPMLDEIRVVGASGGTFRLSAAVDGGSRRWTAPIAAGARVEAIVSALSRLPNIGSGGLRVSPELWVEAIGPLAGTRIVLEADASGLIGDNPEVRVNTRSPGGSDSGVDVTAWEGPTYYFDSSYRGLGDGSEAAPFNTYDDLRELLRDSRGNLRALLKRGSSFAGDDSLVIPSTVDGPIRIGTYGNPSLPRPVLDAEVGPGGTGLQMWATSESPVTDVTIDGVDLRSTGRALYAGVASADGRTAPHFGEIHFLDSAFSSSNTTRAWRPLVQIAAHSGGIGSQIRGGEIVFWNSDFDREQLTVGDHQQGLDLDASRSVAIVGGSISGGGPAPDAQRYYDHHLYANIYDHALFRWVDFQEADGPANMAIKLLERQSSAGQPSPRTLIDGSDITGTQNGLSLDLGGGDGYDPEAGFGVVLLQNSAIHVGPADVGQSFGILVNQAASLVVRDNLFYDNHYEALFAGDNAGALSLGYYRNKVDVPAGPDSSIALYASPAVTRAEIVDNIFQFEDGDKGWEGILKLHTDSIDQWTIEGNQYWAPRGPHRVVFDRSQVKFLSFAQWQQRGYDLRGRYADPRWVDPAHGDFRQRS